MIRGKALPKFGFEAVHVNFVVSDPKTSRILFWVVRDIDDECMLRNRT
jgi:hypothetical protein